jgi:hypothetical protein
MAGYVFKLGRVTSHEPENPHSTEPDNPDTEVITIAAPAPVFVDSTGRRSRRLRRLAYAFGALVMLYGGLISVSLAGGPVRSSAVLPLPGLEPDTEGERVPTRPGPIPAPSPSPAAATPRYVTEAMPRRTFVPPAPARPVEPNKAVPKPAVVKPSAPATPKPTPSTTRPTESTTTKPATRPTTKPATTPPTTSTPTTSTPKPDPVTVPPIVGPVPPGTGGQGGGSVVDPDDESAEPTSSPDTDSSPETGSSSPPAGTPSTRSTEAALIDTPSSVELADLTEQIAPDPEPAADGTPDDEDDA